MTGRFSNSPEELFSLKQAGANLEIEGKSAIGERVPIPKPGAEFSVGQCPYGDSLD